MKKLLLTGVFGPYGINDKYAEGQGMQMELLDNQITRQQGIHSPRQSYWTFPLYLLAENISIQSTVLDFPLWNDFTQELKKGYTHIGINFIVPNILKVKKMTEYIRENHPKITIILGGYGTIIPELDKLISYDEICIGEGVSWLREYFGDDAGAPLKHPVLNSSAFEKIYGHSSAPSGSVLLPGIGCENGCAFCITSHKFNKQYIPLFKSGKEIYEACNKINNEIGSKGFTVLDENFLKHPHTTIDLLQEMTKNKTPYVFDIFSSAENIKRVGMDFLVRLGIRMIWIGIESKTSSFDKTKGIDMAEFIKELQSHGIIANASAILFQEHHDKQSIKEDIDWVISLGADLTQFMNYTPYPTTALFEKYEKEGKMKNLHYRHQHGQGELAFSHPNFDNRKDHIKYLKNAFRKKYQEDGPGILNMAITAINGYINANKKYNEIEEQGLCWNPVTLKYEKSDNPKQDEFMRLRVRRMEKVAMNIRPVLRASWFFAPNKKSRKKSKETIKLFSETLGKPKLSDKIKSTVIIIQAIIEFVRIIPHKILGREGIIYQPPVRRKEYPDRTTSSDFIKAPINMTDEIKSSITV